jgi:hypothetical protein
MAVTRTYLIAHHKKPLSVKQPRRKNFVFVGAAPVINNPPPGLNVTDIANTWYPLNNIIWYSGR